MKDPITTNDIRRWTQAMQNPNRLFYDEELTAEEPGGVRHVLVNGMPIRIDGRSLFDSLQRRPGTLPEIA